LLITSSRVEHVYEDLDRLIHEKIKQEASEDLRLTKIDNNKDMPKNPHRKMGTSDNSAQEKSAPEKKEKKKYFWKKRRTSHEPPVSDKNKSKKNFTSATPPTEEHRYSLEPEDSNPSLPPRMYLHDPEFAEELDIIRKAADPLTEAGSSSASDDSEYVTSDSLVRQNKVKIPSLPTTHFYQPLLAPQAPSNDGVYATVKESSCKLPEEEPQYQNVAKFSLPSGPHKLHPVQCRSQKKKVGRNEEKNVYQNVKSHLSEK